MTPKETATATVETFLKPLSRKTPVLDTWKTHSFMSAVVEDYQGYYTICAEAYKDSPDTITVRVHDFGDDAKRQSVLVVSGINPELAAKFTREAIIAYEKELWE